MSDYILVIDDRAQIEPVLELALRGYTEHGAPVKILSVEDISTAKRRLIQAIPEMIISRVILGGDAQAGVRFCKELRGHTELSRVPVILVSDHLEEQTIRDSNEAGAKALVGWPLVPEALRQRVCKIVPQLVSEKIVSEKHASSHPAGAFNPHPAPAVPTASKASSGPKRKSADDDVDPILEEKVKLAQNLLAKVLHNLKTSDLLQIVEKEDVARVVFEMTRSVCEIPVETGKDSFGRSGVSEREGASNLKTAGKGQETSLDLDVIFGTKR